MIELININELIYDSDFAQPNGITVIRRPCKTENHLPVVEEQQFKVPGIITINTDLEEELRETSNINSEVINVFTDKEIYTTGRLDESPENGYLSDIVVWNGKKYKAFRIMNDLQYGFCRVACIKINESTI